MKPFTRSQCNSEAIFYLWHGLALLFGLIAASSFLSNFMKSNQDAASRGSH